MSSIPPSFWNFESIINIERDERDIYQSFLTKYQYDGIPINISSLQISKELKIGEKQVKKALNNLFKDGYIKVFKDDLYNKNCYIPIPCFALDNNKYVEIPIKPLPINIYNSTIKIVKGKEKSIKFGVYKNKDHLIEIFNS